MYIVVEAEQANNEYDSKRVLFDYTGRVRLIFSKLLNIGILCFYRFKERERNIRSLSQELLRFRGASALQFSRFLDLKWDFNVKFQNFANFQLIFIFLARFSSNR